MENINFIFPEIFISLSIMFLLLFGVFKKNSSLAKSFRNSFYIAARENKSNFIWKENIYKIDFK